MVVNVSNVSQNERLKLRCPKSVPQIVRIVQNIHPVLKYFRIEDDINITWMALYFKGMKLRYDAFLLYRKIRWNSYTAKASNQLSMHA